MENPVSAGLRFSVYDPASYLAFGMTEDEILRDSPDLERGLSSRIRILRQHSGKDRRLKLLVDENLAPKLADSLAHLFPHSIHASSERLSSARFVGSI